MLTETIPVSSMEEHEDSSVDSYLHKFFPADILHTDFFCAHHWTIFLAATTLSLFLILKRKKRNKPPGPWPWPITGHLSYLKNRPYIRLTNLKDTYGDVYQIRVGNYNLVVVCSLEAVMEGLIQKGEMFSGRPDFESLHVLYGGDRERGINTGNLSDMTRMKKNFLDSSLDAYCSSSDNIEDVVAADILEVVNKFLESEAPFNVFLPLESACLNIMTKLTYGQRFDPCGRAMQEMLSTFHARNFAKYSFHSVDYVPFIKAFSPREDLEFVAEKTSNQVDYQRKVLNLHKDSYDFGCLRDMMDQLLLFLETGEDQGLMEKEDIDFLLLDFVNSGYESTAVILTWLLGYMAANQDIQKKVQKELDSVVGNDRLPSLQDQPFLPYTTAVIFEAERLASVFPFLQPHVATENCKLQGFDIAQGSILLFNVWSIHHDTRYWRNPMKFDPSRFLTEENDLEIPDHFLPYGAGSRRCPGESLGEINLFLFFGTIMHQLTVRPATRNFFMEGEFDYIIRPSAFKLRFEEREN